MDVPDRMQIGEVAERLGLSLRTIRYYDEMGLVTPSARTPGGFRLYTELDLYRLFVIKRMKPLGFSLEEMRELLTTLDALDGRLEAGATREELLERLAAFREAADKRVEELRRRLMMAEEFAQRLRTETAARAPGTDDEAASVPVDGPPLPTRPAQGPVAD
ncbi:MerR family transcriptional regulator [Kineococcus xinjiangensis]|uniref:MerR family transcriptional regulator n=1 Tax=Kineococcus xinjiangensis TaxID=512762 RepID=UPI001FE7C0EA|nr:MerR family transcriptional regulator [Kineococcus xinjiangensis]